MIPSCTHNARERLRIKMHSPDTRCSCLIARTTHARALAYANACTQPDTRCSNATFWSMTGPFALNMGAGLLVTNNTASMAHAVMGKGVTDADVDSVSFNLVCIFSVLGTAVRLVVGRCMSGYPFIPAGAYVT
jgi:hypothetical protein